MYQKIYDKIIQIGKIRQDLNIDIGYSENHHIIPRCMGGGEESANLVKLTAREHFISHLLLMRIYPEHEGLVYAANRLLHGPTEKKINSRVYQKIKEMISKLQKGIPLEIRLGVEKAKASKTNLEGFIIREGWAAGIAKYLNYRNSISKQLKNKPKTEEHIKHLKTSIKNRPPQSEESNKKRSKKLRGRASPMRGKKPWNKNLSSRTNKILKNTAIKIGNSLRGAKRGKQSAEHLEKRISQIRGKKSLKVSKKVICIETGQIYESLREAANSLGIKHPCNISKAIRNNDRYSCGGYHWDYFF